MTNIQIFITIIFLNLFFFSTQADTQFDLGKNVFLNKANCAACHILADAKSAGQIGPNLDQIKPELARVLNAVSMGIGVMPAFEGILTDEEIKSVSYYVFKSTNK
jgi:cytochrome c6